MVLVACAVLIYAGCIGGKRRRLRLHGGDRVASLRGRGFGGAVEGDLVVAARERGGIVLLEAQGVLAAMEARISQGRKSSLQGSRSQSRDGDGDGDGDGEDEDEDEDEGNLLQIYSILN
jgi:hypothetical protein